MFRGIWGGGRGNNPRKKKGITVRHGCNTLRKSDEYKAQLANKRTFGRRRSVRLDELHSVLRNPTPEDPRGRIIGGGGAICDLWC